MDWLMHNAVADMRGPVFLLFYGGVIAATLAACYLVARRLDWTARMPPPAVPPAPDPYEIAYLRGGENEVARSVIFALVQRDALRVVGQSKELIEQVPGRPDRRALDTIERRVFDWFAEARTVKEIFRPGSLPAHLTSFCAPYEQKLQREKLLTPPELRQRVRQLLILGGLLIVGLGGYKLLVALSRGRSNVAFLAVMGVVGVVLLVKVCRAPRLSRRGRAYLEKLQLAFERLRYHPAAAAPASAAHAAGATAHAFDPSLLLMVGVFGVGALAGTQYDYYQHTFQRAAAGGGGGGSSCGSSCGSSDSSSSSGGDSGGSCSGGSSCGSSCGGGCGGCGS